MIRTLIRAFYFVARGYVHGLLGRHWPEPRESWPDPRRRHCGYCGAWYEVSE